MDAAIDFGLAGWGTAPGNIFAQQHIDEIVEGTQYEVMSVSPEVEYIAEPGGKVRLINTKASTTYELTYRLALPLGEVTGVTKYEVGSVDEPPVVEPIPEPVGMRIPKLTAVGGSYVYVLVNEVVVSRHSTERKAIQKGMEFEVANPEDEVAYERRERVRVEL